MKFTPLELDGVFLIEPSLSVDERGFFARTWCRREFEDRGLNPNLAQCGASFNKLRGTVRGLHYQVAPHAEAKLVRCTSGSVFDVVVDLRPGSPTYRRWLSRELTAANRLMLYLPEGCAHGFQTIEDGTELAYQMSEFYYPEWSRGIRWNDKSLGIQWPTVEHRIISERDQSLPLIDDGDSRVPT